MALRNIREIGDDILLKKAKEVKDMTDRTKELIDDMIETMYEANGVGLAAPQVGVLKQIITIDTSEEKDDLYVFINPVILKTDGEQTAYEGCLSVPGKTGKVTRPNYVMVRYLDRDMKEQTLEAEDILARAICHEVDHLDGKLYVDLVEGELSDIEDVQDEL
ncbi:MAG: peptide deformylase [Lachnospiraceae bacterium]|nr:peptide deformylase [Lachnospiraceae bacterium]MBR1876111.1 peptide deformylase [Lachnospiraceae bacterium]